MASHTGKPQFRWHLQVGIFAAIALGLSIAPVNADDAAPEGDPSNYVQYRGEPFFLLSDTSYGSNEQAKIRFEVPGRSFSGFEQYGGADIVLYRIQSPLEFIKKQKNLHRIRTDGNYTGEGLVNVLSFLWDDWFRKSRRAWQDIFSAEARHDVTTDTPSLTTPKDINKNSEFSNPPQYGLLSEKNGFKFIQRFRYPLSSAKPIAPPPGVKMQGSSSEFGMSLEGNVYIPLGKLQPGLYLVEAIVGGYRANTMLFVSDTVSVSKASSGQLMVWTARRDTGAPVANTQLMWQDGVGVLGNTKTDTRGLAVFERAAPEKTYLIGVDAGGGVFISENYYYDSEIYNTKIYAVTDRPLYRPGDEVNIKFIGRLFQSARKSDPAEAAPIDLDVLDPNGTPVARQKLQLNSLTGTQTSIRLPVDAVAGGYELRFTYKQDIYSAAFRVAEYVKPHFDIALQPAKDNFKTNEAIKGRLVLTYPDGKPVKSAQIQLTVRSQASTMVEGELKYTGLFPVQLQTADLTTNGEGIASFELPAAKDPSRYVLTAFASDGAAYRVKVTKEILIERSAGVYKLYSQQLFTQPGATVKFEFEPATGTQPALPPARYEVIRLETQTRNSGAISKESNAFSLTLADSGSYTILLYDEKGNMLGAANHWVSGPGVKVVKGSIEIVFDRASYKAGDTAEALITFPEPVDSALLTLERDRVEQQALLQDGNKWLSMQRVAPTQWKAKLRVSEEHAPNMTFSVAYIKNNDWVFQNRGILVEQPRIQVSFKTEKEIYQPGDTVKVQVETQVDGRPVAANLAIGVVDEMIYVLQPEIAPDILDFFYHPRRNNVRTYSSLQFIGYDMGQYRQGGAPGAGNNRERGIKVLERPRRENKDTAYWNGEISTNSSGKASFTFVMPDSLTRWRITGRAMSPQGLVGQRTAYIRSEKPFYAKWISPGWQRTGDAPVAALAVFNQQDKEQTVEIGLRGVNFNKTQTLSAKRGINVINVPLAGLGGDALTIELRADKKSVDKLEIPFKTESLKWKSPRTLVASVTGKQTPITLPKDASNIRLSFNNGAAQQFSRIVDDLDDYPYGCVEQTASRIIPLSYALSSLPPDTGGERGQISRQLRQRLQHQRLRLVYMAGPEATFGWWGNATHEDLLLTAYAYYADYTATRVLGLDLPPSHWEKMLALFKREANTGSHTLLQRGLALWMASDINLPVRNMASGWMDELEKESLQFQPAQYSPLVSPALVDPQGNWSRAMSVKLAAQLADKHRLPLPGKVQRAQTDAQKILEQSRLPSAQALLLMGSKGGDREQAAERILDAVRSEMPTFDRALTMIWLNKVLSLKLPDEKPAASQGKLQNTLNQALSLFGINKQNEEAGDQNSMSPEGNWQRVNSTTGSSIWLLKGNEVPSQLKLFLAPQKPVTAFIQYDSASDEAGKLAVKVERKLYRMSASDSKSEGTGAERRYPFNLVDIPDNDALESNNLYLDEITLTPEAGNRLRYGLAEIPLPPGADVERGTWGIQVNGNALEQARNQYTQGGYAVPVESLDQPVVIRHLVRFSQKGKFNIPPVRFYSMYAPQNKAFESDKTRVVQIK